MIGERSPAALKTSRKSSCAVRCSVEDRRHGDRGILYAGQDCFDEWGVRGFEMNTTSCCTALASIMKHAPGREATYRLQNGLYLIFDDISLTLLVRSSEGLSRWNAVNYLPRCLEPRRLEHNPAAHRGVPVSVLETAFALRSVSSIWGRKKWEGGY
jgi:hypothetical protein